MPTREEVIAYIHEVATRKGIDPRTFETVVGGESGFDPAAQGDYNKKGIPESHGIAQLFDRGEGPEYTRRTGLPVDAESWKQQIDFMADRVLEGGGWKPWHAAKRAGISQYQGLPGSQGQTAQAVGRRGRAGELAAIAQPQAPEQQSGLLDAFREYQEKMNPVGDQTLGGALVSMFSPGRDKLQANEKSQNLLQLVMGGPTEKDAAAAEAVEGYNEFAPMGRAAQLEALKKKKNLGSAVASMWGPQSPGATLGSGLARMFGFS